MVTTNTKKKKKTTKNTTGINGNYNYTNVLVT